MNNRDYREYKDEYLEDLRLGLEKFLNDWIKINNSPYDKKLNDLVVDTLANGFKRMKTLSYFPEYDLEEQDS